MDANMPGSFEEVPSTPKPSSKTRSARTTQRRTVVQRTEDKSSQMPSSLSLVILLVGLALAASNLWLMTGQVGSLNGLEQSWSGLLNNYSMRRNAPAPEATATAPQEQSVKLLYSVTEGEVVLPGLQARLADPIVDYYKMTGVSLNAVLIERKKPLSLFVRVRLFFADNHDEEFLWPFNGSDQDFWVPPCVQMATKADQVQCPAEFLTKYPHIKALMEMKKK